MNDDDVDTGGGGGAPAEDRFERRLSAITTAVENITRNQKQLAEQTAQSQRDSESRQFESQIENYGRTLTANVGTTAKAVDTAEAALAKAHEEGDAGGIARAQRALSEAVATRENARRALAEHKSAKEDYEAQKAAAAAKPKQAEDKGGDRQPDFTNLNDWKNRNSAWYGVDADLTKAAHEIDKSIRGAGVIPVGSTEYFEAIDRQMAKRYPDRFGSSPSTGRGSGAPNGGARPNGGGRIPHSVVDGWRRMGIDVDDPKTIERMMGHRALAVKKGLLPEQPVHDRIRT